MPHKSRSSPREIANYLGRISGPLLDRPLWTQHYSDTSGESLTTKDTKHTKGRLIELTVPNPFVSRSLATAKRFDLG